MTLPALLTVALFFSAMICGFAALVCFLRAQSQHRRGNRPLGPEDRLGFLLGLELSGDAHRAWSRGWNLVVAFLVLWSAAFVLMAILLPSLRP
jgi:hypothetical protein